MKEPAPWILLTLPTLACAACAVDFGIDKRDGWPEGHEVVEAVSDGDDADDVPREEMIIPPSCGDGTVDAGEQCDDGNDSNSDACLNNCENAGCGDGYVWDGMEECDGGVFPCTASCGVEGRGPCSAGCTLPLDADCAPADGRCCALADCNDDNSCTTEECVDTYCIVTPIADMTACTGGVCCDGQCRAGGSCCVDADCDGCWGTPTPCSEIDPLVCSSQSGCMPSAMPQCYGTGGSCGSFTTQGLCDGCGCMWMITCFGADANCGGISSSLDCIACGCTWDVPSCVGGSMDCGGFSTQTGCTSCGCSWNSGTHTCTGSASCADLEATFLCSSCGCTWSPPDCFGSHRPCTSEGDQASCEAELGCSWASCTDYSCG